MYVIYDNNDIIKMVKTMSDIIYLVGVGVYAVLLLWLPTIKKRHYTVVGIEKLGTLQTQNEIMQSLIKGGCLY